MNAEEAREQATRRAAEIPLEKAEAEKKYLAGAESRAEEARAILDAQWIHPTVQSGGFSVDIILWEILPKTNDPAAIAAITSGLQADGFRAEYFTRGSVPMLFVSWEP